MIDRPAGALVVLVAVQLSVPGLYLPPVFNGSCRQIRPRRSFRCRSRLLCDAFAESGALVVLVAVQLSVLGLYLPPVFKLPKSPIPPQTIISLPVHTAV